PVFLFLYWRGYSCARRYNIWYALGIAALGAAITPFNPFAETYLIYACAVAAFCSSWRLSIRLMLAMLALYSLEWVWIGFPWPYLANAVLIGLIVGIMGMYQNVVQARQAELRLSHDEVRRLAASAERERIGRDLHDLLGHTLSLVALKSELARKLALRDPGLAQREMEEVERVARHALGEVRAAVTGMRRSDLAAELLSARLMLEASGIVFACDGCESLDLPHAIEAPLALVLREAVTNIHRHARATEARIDISNAQGELRMRISDNGCGGLAAHGNGVSGMRERVRALGGMLAIDSPPRKGTVLELRVPLAVAAAAPQRAVGSVA
ncbi:sensor histidine kinase, partial [Dyella sp.]|uniref:sensor histidine kinase n=1 Tax=Dyella sp. TaxID=1869338 RepID=UPI003F7D2A8A